MRHMKLVVPSGADPVADVLHEQSANERTARLLADLDRTWDGVDQELGMRAAKCIRELIQQKEQVTVMMLESTALLKTALARLHGLRARI
jgi:hypothetical protein